MLKLIASAARPTNARRRASRPFPTPAQTRSTIALATVARAWQTLTPDQRLGWNALGQLWSPTQKTTATGFTVFQSLNITRLQAGQTTLLADAPQKPDPIAELPSITVQAAYSDALTPGAFTLLVTPAAPYPGSVRLCATAPLSPGVTRYNPKGFRQIGLLPSLAAAPTDLTALYTARFPAPHPGMQIALTLCPLTPNGFKGQHLCAPVIVPITAAPALALSR